MKLILREELERSAMTMIPTMIPTCRRYVAADSQSFLLFPECPVLTPLARAGTAAEPC